MLKTSKKLNLALILKSQRRKCLKMFLTIIF